MLFAPSYADAQCNGDFGTTCNASIASANNDGTNHSPSCGNQCGGAGPSDDRGYGFTAPVTGVYNFSLANNYDAVLQVRNGFCSTGGGNLGCADSAGSGGTEQLNVALAAGQAVTVWADGFDDFVSGFFGFDECNQSQGNFTLTITGPGTCFVCGNGTIEGPEQCEGGCLLYRLQLSVPAVVVHMPQRLGRLLRSVRILLGRKRELPQ